ncbi:MAG TPA: kinase [Caulobacterales bacterium]|nr:kinase [Caulobacterales bacterium]
MSNREIIAGVIQRAIDAAREARPDRAPLIGVAGAQGCGKSFQCRAFAAAHPRVAHFSLDDVYYTRSVRERIANAIIAALLENGHQLYPTLSEADRRRAAERTRNLLVTRGPPGTHDITLLRGLIARLQSDLSTPLPRFDKSIDDRAPETTWPLFQGPADAILIDGWCLGMLPVQKGPPINTVEAEDELMIWLTRVAGEASAYDVAPFDEIIYFRAPSFEIVRRWRGQQEEEMLGRAMTPDERRKLDRFIQFYERISRAMIDGHHRARWIVQLDEERNVVGVEER